MNYKRINAVGTPSEAVNRLNRMITQRLKHDWERAKIEASVPYKHIVGAFLSSGALTWTACQSGYFERLSIARASISHLLLMIFVFLAFLLIISMTFALMRTLVEEAIMGRIAPETSFFLVIVAVILFSCALYCSLVRQSLAICSLAPQNPSALLLFSICMTFLFIIPTFIILSAPSLVASALPSLKQKIPSGSIGVLQRISRAFFLLPKYFPETPPEEEKVYLVRVTSIAEDQKETPEEKAFSVKVNLVPKEETEIWGEQQ